MAIFPLYTSKVKELKKQVSDLNSQVAELRNIGTVNGEFINSLLDKDNSTTVTDITAMNLSAFYAGVNILCDSLNLPIGIYRKDKNGNREPVDESMPYEFKVYNLLHVSPNILNTPAEWIQLMESGRIIYGDGISLILRNNLQEPIALQWFHPSYVDVKYDGKKLSYDFRDQSNAIYLRNISYMDVFHVKNFSSNGIRGRGVIDVAAESMGFGKATQDAGNKFFKDGMTSKYILSHPGNLGGPGGVARKNLTESMEAELKKKSTIVLEEGIKLYTITVPPEQAQFLESRKFSVTEIARWLNIPEFMLANMDPTFSNIENFALHFVTNNVRGRCRIYEQQINWKLLANRPGVYSEFNINALLRADIKSRAQYYVQMVQNGMMLPNEARNLENMNDLEGGNERLTPANLITDKQRESSINPGPETNRIPDANNDNSDNPQGQNSR